MKTSTKLCLALAVLCIGIALYEMFTSQILSLAGSPASASASTIITTVDASRQKLSHSIIAIFAAIAIVILAYFNEGSS